MILQIFGRLCRLTDLNLSAPRVYFVDSAFHATSKDGFDLLNEMNDYLDEMMNGKTKEIAHTLYGGFYNAFKKGIPKNEQRTDDEDEDDDVASEE